MDEGLDGLAGGGVQGLDVLAGINDCCCKTPLIEALRHQCGLLSKEKGKRDGFLHSVRNEFSKRKPSIMYGYDRNRSNHLFSASP